MNSAICVLSSHFHAPSANSSSFFNALVAVVTKGRMRSSIFRLSFI